MNDIKKALPKAVTVNWETTAAGVVQLLIVLLTQVGHWLDSDPATVVDWNIVAVSIGAFVGLLRARDANKSTEDQR